MAKSVIFFKNAKFSHFCWFYTYKMYETLNRKWIFWLKWAMYQACTTNRSRDIEFWLIQPFVCKKSLISQMVPWPKMCTSYFPDAFDIIKRFPSKNSVEINLPTELQPLTGLYRMGVYFRIWTFWVYLECI